MIIVGQDRISKAPDVIEIGDELRNFPDEGIADCSTAWYYRASGTLAHFSACN